MRPILSILLIGLLASCPIVCGTCHAHAHAIGSDEAGVGEPIPYPEPVNDDCCLCGGAVKSADALSSLVALDPALWPAPFEAFFLHLDLIRDLPIVPNPVGTEERGFPIPLAGRGCAGLPNLRC